MKSLEIKSEAELWQEQREKERFETDQVQDHFKTSNTPLIDGKPATSNELYSLMLELIGENK